MAIRIPAGLTISPEEALRRLYNEQMKSKMCDPYYGYEQGWRDPRDKQKEECIRQQMESMLYKKPMKGAQIVEEFHARRRQTLLLLEGL